MSSSLPTPRQLLTSLLNSIADVSIPPPPPPPPLSPSPDAAKAARSRTGQQGRTNPLSLMSATHRPLFTTLHVLFPSLLLPALDLLDRGLVTRLIYDDDDSRGTTHEEQQDETKEHQPGDPDQADEPAKSKDDDDDDQIAPAARFVVAPPRPAIYLVRSAQPPPRRGASSSGGGNPSATTARYIVHAGAWSCTCAAFAFSAFPGQRPASVAAAAAAAAAPHQREKEEAGDGRVLAGGGGGGAAAGQEGERGGDEAWEFGGWSLDGRTAEEDGRGVPCCKHLLACVLAERWEPLGAYVVERRIAKEEMAGVVADV